MVTAILNAHHFDKAMAMATNKDDDLSNLPQGRWEVITKKKADEILSRNTRNRSLSKSNLSKIKWDMLHEKFGICTDPIQIYIDGSVANGQHRLTAISETGLAQECYVIRDVPFSAGRHIDTGKSRTFIDIMRIDGFSDPLGTQMVSTAKAIEEGTITHNTPYSTEQLREVVFKHYDAALFADSNIRKRGGISVAPVHAAIGRAWYIEADKDRLKKFCDVLNTGDVPNKHEDDAARMLREYLLKHKNKAHFNTEETWSITFRRTQKAIHMFMRRDSNKMTFKTPQNEIYPLKKQT